MTIYSFFRKWVNDKMYSLKLKKSPCHPQSKEPLWVPQWTKQVDLDDPNWNYDPDWNNDINYSEIIGNLNYHYKEYDN